MSDIESDVIAGILANHDFATVAMVRVKKEYFQEPMNMIIVKVINDYYDEYNRAPTRDELASSISDLRGKVKDDLLNKTAEKVKNLVAPEHNTEWLLKRTEKFCRDRSIYNALSLSMSIHSGEDKKHTIDAIPEILKEALNVSFDTKIAYDYAEEAGARWDHYNNEVARIKFKIEEFNKITRGGLPREGVLIVPLAGCVHPSTKIKIRRRSSV